MDNDYLIKKPPLQALFLFSLPMIIGNLFQQTYTMVDSAIVGRYVSEQALAAVGASYALTNIFICVAIGGGIGASVIVSRYFGAKEYGRMKTAVFTALLSFLGISLVLGVAGLFLGNQIMIWLNTPQDCLDMAAQYLQIYFLGLPFLFMYNVLSAMFNALGKSRIPLYFLIFSSVFNVVLDIIMVTKMDMGVAGVAWATLIAQGISAVLSFAVLIKNLNDLEGKQKTLFDTMELSEMTRIAIPSILQQSTVSIGMMLVQSVVNGFGSEAMRIESICVVPMSAIGNAVSSYTAQNIGAQQKDRVVQGLHAASKMVIVCAAVICVFLEVFNRGMIGLFIGNEGTAVALSTGIGYLTFMGWFFCFKMAVDGLLRGAGDMKMFTVANLVNLGIRVIIAITCAPRFGIAMVWCAVPVGWFANWAISYAEYRTGKWKTM
jgi:putative MATE family efflux protein